MPNIVFLRLTLGLALLSIITLTWAQLVQHATWHSHRALAADVQQGRAEHYDADRLLALFEKAPTEQCWVLREGSLVTLHLYAVDMRARTIGANAFLQASDPLLTEMREVTRRILEKALACAPLLGDFWLSLALISRSLGEDPVQAAQYLRLSERYAPHEGWISRRRARLF